MPIEACEEYLNAWRKITADRNVCFYAEKHRPEEDETKQKETDWTINKLLSSKGRWSYFEESE